MIKLQMNDYSFRLDDAEIARYRAMAAQALAGEADLWQRAGIGPGARVIDLGCGPGTFLPELVERTTPGGSVVGVDMSDDALRRAAAVIEKLPVDAVRLVHAPAQDTGLPPGQADTVFMRNVLVHNGPHVKALLSHVRALLKPHGRLLAVEPDLTQLDLPADSPADRELEDRWEQWARAVGNDPGIGAGLSQLIQSNGFEIDASRVREDILTFERPPSWTAVETLEAAGFATPADVERWRNQIESRLATTGPITARLPMHVVVARPSLPQ